MYQHVDHDPNSHLPRSTARALSLHEWSRVIVLANRAPFRHERTADGRISIVKSASGVVTALEPLVDACAGTWVAHAGGDADLTIGSQRNGLGTLPASPRYRLRYVQLADAEYQGYYYGFANEGLWPLCHCVPVQPVFRPKDFRMYRTANRRFTEAVADEAGGAAPLVLVQDYHFALAPQMLRRCLSQHSTIVAFWHIPWPPARIFRQCPWGAELLEGLLGSDIIGVQTDQDRDNFLESVVSMLGANIQSSDDLVVHRGHSTRLRVYPVGVEWNSQLVRALPSVRDCREWVCRAYHLPDNVTLGIGIDRLDYTKGIHEKFLTIERLLERRPELRGSFAFIQVAEPSRQRLRDYRMARAQLEETVHRVNARFGSGVHQPIRLLDAHHDALEVYRFYRAADFCYVGSLHDGMNLVAKEFVSARTDHRGVLVLSQFAGAARQLRAAVLVNPYDIDASADALAWALAMPRFEQTRRMRLLRANVSAFDSRWWARRLFDDARSVRGRAAPASNASACLLGPLTHWSDRQNS